MHALKQHLGIKWLADSMKKHRWVSKQGQTNTDEVQAGVVAHPKWHVHLQF